VKARIKTAANRNRECLWLSFIIISVNIQFSYK
jgi:hypothetical protein